MRLAPLVFSLKGKVQLRDLCMFLSIIFLSYTSEKSTDSAVLIVDKDASTFIDAAQNNEDIGDFIYRAENWYSTWFAEYMASDDSMWSVGCGWE